MPPGPLRHTLTPSVRGAEKLMTYLWTSLRAVRAMAAEGERRKDRRIVIDECCLTEPARQPTSVPAAGDRITRIAVVQPAATKVA